MMAESNEEDKSVSAGSLPQPQPPSSSKESDHDTLDSIRNDDIRQETEKRVKEKTVGLEAEKKVRKALISDLAREHFHSHAGIIYASDDLWTKLKPASGPCHLYVALKNLEKASLQQSLPDGCLPDRGVVHSIV